MLERINICFSCLHTMHHSFCIFLFSSSLWHKPDNDKLHSVEAGGGSEGNKSKREKDVRAGVSLALAPPLGDRLRRLTSSHNSVGVHGSGYSETMQDFGT